MSDKGGTFPAPWLSVEEDPLTGLPNMLALIAALPGPGCGFAGVAVEFDIVGLSRINAEKGHDEGDRALVLFSRSLARAASQVGPDRVSLYRLGGDEFCAIVKGSKEDCCRLVISMCCDDSTPAFRYGMSEFTRERSSSREAFFEIWADLEEGLQRQRSSGADPIRHLASRLVEQIKETVQHLIVSRRLAYTDDVSGLPNQRAARYMIGEHLKYARDSRLSLLFVDGDNLKKYNDNLGYEPGNEMIRRLGAVLSGVTLPGEMVARWLSGDEFVVVLPGYGKRDAMEKADSICASVKEESANWVYPVTVSVGVATYPDDAQDLPGLLSKAEEANARAKSLGKDRVCGD